MELLKRLELSTPSAVSTTLGTDSILVAFQKLDTDNDGGISMRELERGMRAAGIPAPSNEKLNELFSSMDCDGDRRITVLEFRAFCEKRRAALRVVYDRLEDNNLTTLDIARAFRDADMRASSSQLRAIVKGASSSGDKSKISFDKFCELLLLIPAVNPEAVFEAVDFIPIDSAQSEYSLPKSNEQIQNHGSQLEKQLLEVSRQLYYGGVAGVVSRTATAPIDRLKVMAQAGTSSSMAESIRQIYASSGLRAFYRGNLTNCCKIAPETAIKFLAFDHCKSLIAADKDNVSVRERFIAGGLAGAITQVSIYPLEIVKTRLNVAKPGQYSSILNCMRTVVSKEGIAALYRGCGASILGIFPYAGIDLMMNSVLRERGTQYFSSIGREPGIEIVVLSGMISSSFAMLLTYPINLVRTKLQLSGMEGAVEYRGVRDCVAETLRRDGWRGLYRGIVPNLIKVMPSASISYTVYDLLKNMK